MGDADLDPETAAAAARRRAAWLSPVSWPPNNPAVLLITPRTALNGRCLPADAARHRRRRARRSQRARRSVPIDHSFSPWSPLNDRKLRCSVRLPDCACCASADMRRTPSPILPCNSGLKCNVCHVNPTGGGLRTTVGDVLAQTAIPGAHLDTGADNWTGALGPVHPHRR